MSRRSILLCGGLGRRFAPTTLAYNKQLINLFDRPIVYYSLSVLLLAGSRDILIISNPENIDFYKRLFGTGEKLGISISYEIQAVAAGIAQSFIIGQKFLGDSDSILLLGDNFFFLNDFTAILKTASLNDNATIFVYKVPDASQYGVLELDKDKKPLRILEKPKFSKSNWAVTGLYFYDNKVVEYSKSLKLSARNEYEISDINQIYLNNGCLNVRFLGRAGNWFDLGSAASLLQAANFVQATEQRLGAKICCPEEIAYNQGYIDQERLLKTISELGANDYSDYLKTLISV